MIYLSYNFKMAMMHVFKKNFDDFCDLKFYAPRCDLDNLEDEVNTMYKVWRQMTIGECPFKAVFWGGIKKLCIDYDETTSDYIPYFDVILIKNKDVDFVEIYLKATQYWTKYFCKSINKIEGRLYVNIYECYSDRSVASMEKTIERLFNDKLPDACKNMYGNHKQIIFFGTLKTLKKQYYRSR